ncbi:unnamed protein product [Lupinus luteus]|uniref:Phytocyanin domain-containing protein n=1 Tax=Lupinus luteus TaxID=3873 RepID=A0AAV1Y087_LUPLU
MDTDKALAESCRPAPDQTLQQGFGPLSKQLGHLFKLVSLKLWAATHAGRAGARMGGPVVGPCYLPLHPHEAAYSEYNPKLDSVVKVNQEDYNSCNSKGALAVYKSGNDRILLPTGCISSFLVSMKTLDHMGSNQIDEIPLSIQLSNRLISPLTIELGAVFPLSEKNFASERMYIEKDMYEDILYCVLGFEVKDCLQCVYGLVKSQTRQL